MSYTNQHLNEVRQVLELMDSNKIEEVIRLLNEVKLSKGRVFFLGVGGSAANASHAVNDFRKLANIESYAPTDNISELTARTNDDGWTQVFSGWLKVSQLNSKDCLFILSVGGGDREREISVNLCEDIDFAKTVNAKIVGITGRSDGYTAKHADSHILIPNVNTENMTPHSESFQAIVWHLMVSHPILKASSTKW